MKEHNIWRKTPLRAGLSDFAVLTALLFFAPNAQAQSGSASGMFGVEEVIIQYTRLGNAKTAEACGLSREKFADILKNTLQDNGVPAIPVDEAKPALAGVTRIDLVPSVFSYNGQGLDCISWVSLSVESRNRVHIPPIDIPRSVIITYWREGALISSDQITHQRVVGDALQKQAKLFADQYKLDQPPALPSQ
jgi:hypothetical protein